MRNGALTTSLSVASPRPLTVLLLTHKRAGAVVVFPSKASSASEAPSLGMVRALEKACASPEQPGLERTEDGVTFLQGDGIVVGLGGSQTAEMLARLYTDVLNRMGGKDAHVGELQVVVGPGSFTGLRLGCAFANGLVLGNPARALSALPAASPECVASVVEQWPLLSGFPQGVTIPQDDDDPFSAPVSFADVLAQLSLEKTRSDPALLEFFPAYGRDPGPVLKLRSQGGSV